MTKSMAITFIILCGILSQSIAQASAAASTTSSGKENQKTLNAGPSLLHAGSNPQIGLRAHTIPRTPSAGAKRKPTSSIQPAKTVNCDPALVKHVKNNDGSMQIADLSQFSQQNAAAKALDDFGSLVTALKKLNPRVTINQIQKLEERIKKPSKAKRKEAAEQQRVNHPSPSELKQKKEKIKKQKNVTLHSSPVVVERDGVTTLEDRIPAFSNEGLNFFLSRLKVILRRVHKSIEFINTSTTTQFYCRKEDATSDNGWHYLKSNIRDLINHIGKNQFLLKALLHAPHYAQEVRELQFILEKIVDAFYDIFEDLEEQVKACDLFSVEFERWFQITHRAFNQLQLIFNHEELKVLFTANTNSLLADIKNIKERTIEMVDKNKQLNKVVFEGADRFDPSVSHRLQVTVLHNLHHYLMCIRCGSNLSKSQTENIIRFLCGHAELLIVDYLRIRIDCDGSPLASCCNFTINEILLDFLDLLFKNKSRELAFNKEQHELILSYNTHYQHKIAAKILDIHEKIKKQNENGTFNSEEQAQLFSQMQQLIDVLEHI